MLNNKIPEYFDILYTAVDGLLRVNHSSHRDALIVLLDLLGGNRQQADLNQLDTQTQQVVQSALDIDWKALSLMERRNVVQLLLLKAYKADKSQMNAQLTPDGIGYLLGDFIYQTAGASSGDTMLDLTVGSGNLLYTVAEVFDYHHTSLKLVGLDNDESQLALAHATDYLLHDQETVDLYQTDVVTTPDNQLAKAKIVLADLPVGYYSVEAPGNMLTKADKGESLAHFLLIERALDFVEDNGWLYFIVPANILEGPAHERLLKLITQKMQLKAFLKLPANYFANAAATKAILVLRPFAAAPQGEVLVGTYPDINQNSKAFEDFLQDIKSWVKLNHGK